jgi:purine-binding chemotaxis protein CheW
MSSLSETPKKPTFDRKNEERRRDEQGPPEGQERRQSVADRRVENNVEYVTFYLKNHLLGIPVALVQEVIPRQKVTKIPRAEAEIRGLMNLRGQIVTVVNLRRKLGFEDGDPESHMNVIIDLEGELLSLEVDSVGDVLPVSRGRLLAPPPTLDRAWQESCENVVQLEEGLLIIVGAEKLFKIQSSDTNGEK